MAPYPQFDGTFFVMVVIHLIKQFPARITLKQGTDHQQPKIAFEAQLFQIAWGHFLRERGL